MNKIIEVIKYIILGIIQGVAEIFPISSSGHLTIFYFYFKINENDRLNLTLFLHLASCLALIIYYNKTLFFMIKSVFLYVFKKDKNYIEGFKLFIYLVVASIPSIIVGFLIKPFIEKSFNSLIMLSIGFLLTSIILLISKFIKNNKNTYSFKNTFVTGVFQSFALLPGISRSATTMLGAKSAKLEDNNAKQFTFLLLIPITLGSTFMSFLDVSITNYNNLYLYLIAFIVTFVVTLVSLKLFIKKYTSKHNLYFSFYLICLSLIVSYIYYLS